MSTLLVITMTSAVTSDPRPARLMREGRLEEVQGGLDFSSASWDPVLGRLCIMREDRGQQRLERTGDNNEKKHLPGSRFRE